MKTSPMRLFSDAEVQPDGEVEGYFIAYESPPNMGANAFCVGSSGYECAGSLV
jgi:hypothetical protein